MTVVCSSCGTRYAIADGRVQGRAFKVRCRRCENIILHQPDRPSEAEGIMSLDPSRDRAAAPAAAPEPQPQPQLALHEPDPPSLTATRHEQSVLFSLGNLQALALSTAPHTGRRGSIRASSTALQSGLIDIRGLAASVSSEEMLPDTAGVPAAFVPPVLLPAPTRSARWILPTTVALGSALVLSLLALTSVLLLRPGAAGHEPPPAPRAPTATPLDPRPAPPPAAPTAAPIPSPAPAPSLTPPPRSARVAVSRRERVPPRRTPPREKVAREAPAAAPDPIGKLIDDAVKRPAPTAAPRARAVERPLPEELTKEQIVAGMRGVRARVQACHDRYRVAGTASVRVSISPEGRVVAVKVSGRFAGTPTGQCLSLAVQATRFPRFRGPAALTIPEYPFILQ